MTDNNKKCASCGAQEYVIENGKKVCAYCGNPRKDLNK